MALSLPLGALRTEQSSLGTWGQRPLPLLNLILRLFQRLWETKSEIPISPARGLSDALQAGADAPSELARSLTERGKCPMHRGCFSAAGLTPYFTRETGSRGVKSSQGCLEPLPGALGTGLLQALHISCHLPTTH